MKLSMSDQLRFIVDELPTAKERENALYAAIDGIENEINRAMNVLKGGDGQCTCAHCIASRRQTDTVRAH